MPVVGFLIFVAALMYGSQVMASDEPKKPLVENVPPQFKKYDDLFKKYASKYNLDWRMLRRISWIESRVGTDSRTSKGQVSFDGLSWGLMQVAPKVGSPKEIEIKGNPTISQLNDADFSINLASKLLSYLSDKGYSERDIVMAYNQGERNQDRLLQLEKQGLLQASQYPAARDYWSKYQKAKEVVG